MSLNTQKICCYYTDNNIILSLHIFSEFEPIYRRGIFLKEQQLFDRFPILKSLSADKKQQVYEHFRTAPENILDELSIVNFPKETVFINEGQPAENVYIIACGSVKAIEYRVLGIQYDFIQFTKVYSLGGMEVIMDLPLYRTTLKTLEPCIAIQIGRESFENWLMSDIYALKYETKLMGEYLLEQGRLAREYMFLPGPERLAKLFVQQYEKHAENGILTINSNRQNLANETGFGIKTVNRAVKSLSDGGYITKAARSIIITHDQYLSLKRLIAMIIAPETDN